MELRQLTYFAAVVEEGTVQGAARRLHMTQPPLSAQLHALEEELGCRLFERRGRRLHLTEAGSAFYQRACNIDELCSALRAEMADYGRGTAGVLRLGAMSSVSGTRLPALLQGFAARCPAVRYEICEANTYQLLEQLRTGQVDLAFVRTPYSAPDLQRLALRREGMLAVAQPDFWAAVPGAPAKAAAGEGSMPAGTAPAGDKSMPASAAPAGDKSMSAGDGSTPAGAAPAGPAEKPAPSAALAPARPTLPLAALSGQPLLIYRRWEQILRSRFEALGLTPAMRCRCDDARTVLALAEAGLGVGLVPVSALDEKTDLRSFLLQDAALSNEIDVLCRQRTLLPCNAGLFWDYLAQEAVPPAQKALP